MAIFVSVFGLFMVIVGLVGVTVPAKLVALVARWRAAALLRSAVVLRVALGVLFLVAAPYCRAPGVVRVVGVIAIVAALVLLAMGPIRFGRFMTWWLEKPPRFMRLLSLVAIPFGVLVTWAGGWLV